MYVSYTVSCTHAHTHTPTCTHTHTQALTEAMDSLGINYVSADLKVAAQELLTVNVDSVMSLSPEHYQLIRSIWADHGIQVCYERRREFQLSDSTK